MESTAGVNGLFSRGMECFLFGCIVKKGVGCGTNEQALGTFVLKSSRLYVLSGKRAVSV